MQIKYFKYRGQHGSIYHMIFAITDIIESCYVFNMNRPDRMKNHVVYKNVLLMKKKHTNIY